MAFNRFSSIAETFRPNSMKEAEYLRKSVDFPEDTPSKGG